MKFRQISFKTFQKSKSKKKKNKETQPIPSTEETTFDVNDNAISQNCTTFDDTQNVSPICSLRRYKTSVTPRNKIVIQNRRTAFSDDEDDDGLKYELDDIEKVLCSARKERTRIKTNPWIPPRKSLHEADLINAIPEGVNTQDYLNVCMLAEEAGRTFNSTESEELSDINAVTKRTKKNLSLSEVNDNRWSIISEGDVSIDLLDSPTIEDLNERFANIDYAIDFKYEENIDIVLDDEKLSKQAKRLSINDLLEDYNDDSLDSSNSSMEISDSTSYADSESSEHSSDNQVPCELPIFSINKNKMDESIDAGYSSYSRDSRFPSSSDSDSTESETDECTGNTTIVGDIDCETEGACADCESERSLPEIRFSLQEKVNQLRAEKMIVEEKIKEAQEDDKIRQKETQKFRRYLPAYKKQVLIKTLNSLKERLENQSQRLQKSYTTVLSMQRRFARRHNPFFMVPNSNFQ